MSKIKNMYKANKEINYIESKIKLPPSQFKSIRQLVISALTNSGDKEINIHDFSMSKDSQLMINALNQFGWKVTNILDTPMENPIIKITGGLDKMQNCDSPIFLGSSGLSYRLAMVIAALGKGSYDLIGDNRMNKRAVGALDKGLQYLNIAIKTVNGYPPCSITGQNKKFGGGDIFISGKETSQFHTALLIGGAQNENGLTLRTDNLVSKNYIQMTKQLIEKNGVKIDSNGDFNSFTIKGNQDFEYNENITVETDLILATNFLFLTSMVGGILETKIPEEDLINDKWILPIFNDFFNSKISINNGILKIESEGKIEDFDIDAYDIPFLVPNLAISALRAEGKCFIRNINSSKNKMTNRKDCTIPQILKKLGANIEITETDLIITPPKGSIKDVEIKVSDHKNDHRIVMALICLSQCKGVDIKIENPDSVKKTFPEFLDVLKQCTNKE